MTRWRFSSLSLRSPPSLVPQTSMASHIGHFFVEMGLGAALGYLGGKGTVYIINHIRLEWDGCIRF